MTLAEFLLERIAEDEAVAHGSELMRLGVWGNHLIRDRVLAECEAKRRIVEKVQELGLRDHPDAAAWYQGYAFAVKAVLADLALPYADHPDYLEEWKL